MVKTTILLKWNNKHQISTTQRLHLLRDHIIKEKQTSANKNQLYTFNNIFSPMLSSVNIDQN